MTETIKLTWVQNKSYVGFKKVINGKIHYLGRDESIAQEKAAKIINDVAILQPNIPTVGTAIVEFKQFVDSAAFAPSWRITLKQRISDVAKFMDLSRPIESIDHDYLSGLVNKLLSCPTPVKKKIAVETAVNYVKASRRFFGWLDETGRWIPNQSCRKWEKLFTIRGKIKKQIKFRKIEMISLEEWAKCYVKADKHMKALLMLALNCGQTQNELATLMKDSVAWPKARLSRLRNKTGIGGSWLLWQRTMNDVQKATAKDGELMFLTNRGLPLVHYGTGTTDSVGLRWRRLRKTAGIASHGFRFIRKLGAQMVRETADLETAQQYLSHGANSVAESFYTNPVEEKLDRALRQLEARVEEAITQQTVKKMAA
jgi:integrase